MEQYQSYQYQDNAILSGAILKDKARQTLSGKYGKAILAGFFVALITLGCQVLFGFLLGFVYYFIFICQELGNGTSLEELVLLLQDPDFVNQFPAWYDVLEYIVLKLSNTITGVFNAGMSLFCLNLACQKTARVSDIFYGFRYQFKKSLHLAFILVLVNELSLFPRSLYLYLVRHHASWDILLPVLCAAVVCLIIYVPLSLGISQSFLLLLDFPDRSAKELLKLSRHIMNGHKRRLFFLQLSFIPLLILGLLSFGIGNLWLTPYMNVTYTFFFLNLMHAKD